MATTIKMQSVSVHVGVYAEPGRMEACHRIVMGVDQDGQVWEHTKRGWVQLSMDVAEA
jgi:hypothetical protein